MLVICGHKNICKVSAGKCFHAEEHEAEEGADDCRTPSECKYDAYDNMIHIVACVEV